MVEITEAMKEMGITQAVWQRWLEEDDPGDEPGPFQTRGDTLILEQRRAEAAARKAANGTHNGNGVGKKANVLVAVGTGDTPRYEEETVPA